MKRILDELHDELVGSNGAAETDMDKVIQILVHMSLKIEEQEYHTHKIT